MVKILKIIGLCGCLFITLATQSHAQIGNKLQAIDDLLQLKLDKSKIPGLAIAIVHQNQIIFSKGYGKDGNDKPITGDSPLAIASLSKSFTAMAIMQLVEAGKINLDTPLNNYIPSFEMNDARASQITIRHLLNQTSGLSDMVYPELSFRQQPVSVKNTIENLKKVSLASNPGQKFHYHNPNYQILARLVEVVSKESFSAYLTKHIFEPLQMTQTSNVTNTKAFFNKTPNLLSKGNIFVFGKPMKLNEPEWLVEGAAGMTSTANDMAKWLILHLNKGQWQEKQLLSHKGIQQMFTPPSNIKSSYGMGWIIDEQKNVSHTGILWTYQAEQVLLPKEGYGVVILFNSGINALQDYHAFMQGVTDILTNQKPELPYFSNIIYEILIGLSILITIILGVYRLRQLNKWVNNYKKRPLWNSWIRLICRLLPLILFIFLSPIMAFLFKRALSWERIFLMMPNIIIWLGIVALMNIIIVVTRIVRLIRNNNKQTH